MKAPEKIYLQKNTTTDCYEEFWPEWFEARAKDTDIEYIRTDIFIEKAIEWMKESITNNPECNRIISKKGSITIGELIEDFTEYIKRVTVCG